MNSIAYSSIIEILEIAHNERFGIAALLSVKDKISYCVFDCVEFGIKKRAKWQQLQKGISTLPLLSLYSVRIR